MPKQVRETKADLGRRRCASPRFHFRHARRYEYPPPPPPPRASATSRRDTRRVPLEIVDARVRGDACDVQFKVAWVGRAGSTTWEPESRLAEFPAMIDAFERRRVERGRPAEVVAEGTHNATTRRRAHAEWVAADWASRFYTSKSEVERAEIATEHLQAQASLSTPGRVVLRVCYVKVESLLDLV